jgi:succinylglutamate desuccinylase
MIANHIIGSFEGKQKGDLTFVVGAMHGNELAGVRAIEFFLKMLEVEPITNPTFQMKGKIVGLKGHISAMALGKRFINNDLNRQWTLDNVEKSLTLDLTDLDAEQQAIRNLLTIIKSEITDYQPVSINFLDIHTTSAQGGIFIIPAENDKSVAVATAMHAPIVRGLLNGLEGTSLHYFNEKNIGLPTTAICFEAGQHNEAEAINRSIAAIIFLLQAVGSIKKSDISRQHTKILEEYAKDLPKVTDFFYRHAINKGDSFEMLPNFKNFDFIKKGTHLATDSHGIIVAPEDCYLLMPLYQAQGDDGFFLVRDALFKNVIGD